MFDSILTFERTKLIPFLMVGYPNLEASEQLAMTMIESGIEVLELGVPFSDPMADGKVIQMASAKALSCGTTLKDVLALCGRIHQQHPHVKLIIFSYLNPLLAFGLSRYVQEAHSVGVAASLTVDLPPEEAEEYLMFHQNANLKTVFLASPTTSKDRIKLISEYSTAFIYYISRLGVTGAQNNLSSSLDLELNKIKSLTNKPIAVGFGVSNCEQIKYLSQRAQGVVVGSALVKIITESPSLKEAQMSIRDFLISGQEVINNNLLKNYSAQTSMT